MMATDRRRPYLAEWLRPFGTAFILVRIDWDSERHECWVSYSDGVMFHSAGVEIRRDQEPPM